MGARVPILGHPTMGAAALELHLQGLSWSKVAEQLAAARGCDVSRDTARRCAVHTARRLAGPHRRIVALWVRPDTLAALAAHGDAVAVARLVLEALAARPELLAQAVKLARREPGACIKEAA